MQLVVENVAKSFGIHEIFKDVSFMLDRGEKVGLVGVNGGGKTTLLRCLLAPETVDSGFIKFEPGLRIGYVEQGFQGIGAGTLWQFLVNAGKDILELRQKMAELEKQVTSAKGTELDSLLADYARVSNIYEHADGYNYENRIKIVLHGLGFPENEWDKPAENFSGGQKTRILLAAALVKGPDLLILDEPTNHLDIRMTEWLEGYLRDFKGGVLIVSHDRFFLNNVVGRVLEMAGGRLQNFKGNYDQYLAQKEIQMATLEAAYEAQQEYIERTEAYIRRFKAGIKSKMARGRQSQLNRLERIEGPERIEEFELRLPPAPESAERVLVLEELSVGYGENVLLKGIDLVLRKGEMTALLGPNGAGKTTAFNMLTGVYNPTEGEILFKGEVINGKKPYQVTAMGIARTFQNIRLFSELSVLENVKIAFDMHVNYSLAEAVARFGRYFPQEKNADEKALGLLKIFKLDRFKDELAKNLPYGEQRRLEIARALATQPKLLLLDEPAAGMNPQETHELMEMIRWIKKEFSLSVLLIEHDMSLVMGVCERIYVLEYGICIANGTPDEIKHNKRVIEAYLGEEVS